MAADSDEEGRLRSAALQNAQSILLARKQAEEDLVRAKEALEERTAALERNAIENTKLLRALRESDRRKDEFLAMLAHELRNPLAPIANATQIARALPGPTPELTWAMDVIERQLHQMTRLVDDLLDVSRLNEGRIELRKESVEAATLVDMAVEVCRPLFHDRGHDLRLDVPAESIPLEVDPTRLTQVLLNLLGNAAKYTDPGGRVDLIVRRDGTHLEIKVRDNGIGISPDHLADIFEMFRQVERSMEHSRGGLGIGLTLAKRLVELHGGVITVRSDGRDRGSEFTVMLPLATKLVAPSILPDSVADEVPFAQRILVVDDNRDAAETLARLLTLLGMEVDVAHDGIAAMEALPRFRPDVLLLDLGMPKLDGYETARRMREMAEGRRVFIVALTGWGQEEDRRRSYEAGFDEHLTKPVQKGALQQLLVRARAGAAARASR